MEGKKNGRFFCNHRYRIFQKEGFRWNLYPILPISHFKTVARDFSPAPNLIRRMALGGRVGSRGGDPGASVHGTQETSADTFFATHLLDYDQAAFLLKLRLKSGLPLFEGHTGSLLFYFSTSGSRFYFSTISLILFEWFTIHDSTSLLFHKSQAS